MMQNRPISKQETFLPTLLEEARKGCQDIKDSTKRKVNISLADCLMSGVAMFGLKYPSLLQFDEDFRDENAILQHNLKSLYGIARVPSDTYFRERADEVRITVNSNTHFSLKANACFTSIRTLISALTEQSDKGHVSWTLFMRPKTSARAF